MKISSYGLQAKHREDSPVRTGPTGATVASFTGLLRHEVIVSTNYRLGIFGFLANSAFGHNAGDYGLQDQQAAMRWVQQNIAAFGGDPRHVTIFGESGGASSVCDQIASPTARGLFEQAIDGSGEYNTLFGGPGVRLGGQYDLEPQDCKSSLPSEPQAESIGARLRPGTAGTPRRSWLYPLSRFETPFIA